MYVYILNANNMYMCVLLIYVEFYVYISCSQNLFDFLNKNLISIKNVE